MQKTQNFSLNKPEASDPMRLADFNQNSDIIDAALNNLSAERIVTGSYTGDGTEERMIDLPFTPRIVLLFARFGSGTVYERLYVITDQNLIFIISESSIGFLSSAGCTIVENGLKVGGTATNYNDKVNHYIAFQ